MKRLVILFAVALPLFAQPGLPPEIQKAQELMVAGDHAAAIDLLNGLAKWRPLIRANAWFHIAASHAMQKNADEALRYLKMVRDSGSFDTKREVRRWLWFDESTINRNISGRGDDQAEQSRPKQ